MEPTRPMTAISLLELTLPTPTENLAADEALLEAAEAGSGDVLRFWESPEPFVVVGYANRVATEVNVPACMAAGVPILRRCSGGGTVLLGPGCLAYTLVLQIGGRPELETITGTNQFIMERHRAALGPLVGSPVRVEGHTDLVLGDHKFSGNAQRRKRRAVLFHGTMLYAFDLLLIERFLRLPSLRPAYRGDRAHPDFVGNFPTSSASLRAVLAREWNAVLPGRPPAAESIRQLVGARYGRPEWNERR